MSFRREPTLYLSVAASLLGLLVTIGFSWLTAEQAAVIIAVLNAGLGVYNAVKVRPIAPAAFTYFVGAAAALAAAYGFEVAQETVGAVNGVVLTVLALLTRVQVTPKDAPAPSLDPARPVTLVDPPIR